MFHSDLRQLIGMAVALGSAGASAALADGHRHCCKPDVDLDSLDAKLVAHDGQWIVKVRYNVDVDDACASDRFLLSVHLSEDDCRILDADGRAFGVVVPLEAPVHCDDDEQEFEACFDFPAPAGIRCLDDLRLHGVVTREGDNCRLDDESTDVEVCRPRVIVRHVAPVVEVRPAPVVEVVRPAPVIVHRVAPPIVVHERVAPRVFVRDRFYRGGHVGVRVQTDDVAVRAGARW